MTDTPLWQPGAAELALRTRSGDVTAEAAVRSAVDRMRTVYPGLNAVVTDLGDAATEQARARDRARASGAMPGPLFGCRSRSRSTSIRRVRPPRTGSRR